MAKQLMHNMKLDMQLGRYLTVPITLNDIRAYSVNRRVGNVTMLTLEIYVDSARFDQAEKKEGE